MTKAPGVQPSEFRPYSYCKTEEPGSWNCFKSSLRCQLQEGSRGELRSRSTFQRGLCYSLAFSEQPNTRELGGMCQLIQVLYPKEASVALMLSVGNFPTGGPGIADLEKPAAPCACNREF